MVQKMRRIYWVVAVALLAAAPAASLAQPPAPDAAEQLQQRFVEVSKRVGPAVVSISTEAVERVQVRRAPFGGVPFSEFDDELFDRFFRDFFGDSPEEFKQRGLGTGVIIDPEGYILTNEHVVHGAEKLTVTLPDGREFKGQIQGSDPRSDLAVIRIDAKDLPAAELGDSGQIKTGQWVVAVGNPFGWAVGGTEPSITVGIISALHRSIRLGGPTRDYSDLIQTDAAINPGNSGGPLADLNGRVVGINVAIFSTTGGYQGIGFAIPVNVAKSVVGDLIQGKKVSYGWLGVNVQDITEELQQHFGLSSKEGAIVARVLKGGPADKGGLKEGDVIVRVGDEPVKNVQELMKRVARAKVGEKIPLRITRDGKPVALTLEIGERPSDMRQLQARGAGAWRGLEVSEVTPELARRFELEGPYGVVVTDVQPSSPADAAGLRPGDLIVELDRRPVRNLQEFRALTRAARGKALVRTNRGFFVLGEGSPQE